MSFSLDNIVSAKPSIGVQEPSSSNVEFTPPEWKVCRLPSISSITYAQAAFIDNGEDGSARASINKLRKDGQKRRSTGQRYALALEVWTVPAEDIKIARGWQFKRNIELRPPNPFLSLIDGQKAKGAISDAFAKRLADCVLDIPLPERDKCLFGQIRFNHNGYHVHDDQFVVVTSNSKGELICFVYNVNEEFFIEGFNDQFARGNIKFTAFVDRCAYQTRRKALSAADTS